MWDIIGYVEKEVSLLLRKGDVFFILRHPWDSPVAIPLLLASPKAEAIKIADDNLVNQVRVRAQAHAIHHACAMSRGALSGKTADSMEILVKESLKFALRRRKAGLCTAQDFIHMLVSCSILEPIPESFWIACSAFMSEEAIDKLKDSLESLNPLRPSEDWLQNLIAYLQRVKWLQNEFPFIQTVSRQLASAFRDHALNSVLNELRMQSGGLIQREEIERDMQTQKPWQKNAIPTKKTIRIGPSSASRKTQPKGEGDSKT